MNSETEKRRVKFDSTKERIPSDEFCNNYVSTTKYTILTFLPKNLFEQFKKKANFYFLCIAILSSTPASPKRPEVSILPLLFVLTVSAVKEAFEDYARYKMDMDVNNSLVDRWAGPSGYEKVQWQDITVGDVLLIEEDGAFPADLMMLQSSSHQGVCNIETSNLDGETNLKIKKAVAPTYQIPATNKGEDYLANFQLSMECSLPSEKMDKSSWTGNLKEFNGRSEDVPVGMTQMLLRGCTLRNTKWVLCVVVFTGSDTKLMLNNKPVPFKRSNVERTVDKALYVIFALQASLAIFGTIAGAIWLGSNNSTHYYLGYDSSDNIALESFQTFFTYIVLLDLLVPISLYVSMEVVKFMQAWLINQDLEMYDEESDTPAKARTSNLNEELGQVDYIFSDKTGTLTQNKMEFLRCSIGGVKYGPGEMKESGEILPPFKQPSNMPKTDDTFRFEDNRIPYHALEKKYPNADQVDKFLQLLSVCHTVITESSAEGDGVDYQAASPDERALVIAAKNLGYYFNCRQASTISIGSESIDGQTCSVLINGEHVLFEILVIVEFNSTRKRMSVIVRDPRDNSLSLFCKGADNVIFDRMTDASKLEDWPMAEHHLREYASDGLRTLCCGYRKLSEDEFLNWYSKLKKAQSALEERDHQVAACAELIENRFHLIGCTAIEDRLQEGVPECIFTLANANIKIWVLTGDKVETAINIGRSCRLLTEKMVNENLIVIDISESLSDHEASKLTQEAMDKAWAVAKKRHEGDDSLALVISGKALGFMFPARKRDAKGREILPTDAELENEHELQQKLLKLCCKCKAVVCCRVSPKQKSQVVLLVRNNVADCITLAIGDGANDVSMIKAAHVGIGISGQEGLQAVMSSDYAIAQFRFLSPLLLVHGAWSYRRISLLINYSFYKNIAISLCQMLFTFYNGFSAQVFFDAFTGSCFNLFFTAAPIVMLGVFNRDVSRSMCLRYPSLYRSGQQRIFFNLSLLASWIVKGTVHAIILFFFGVFILDNPLDSSGRMGGQWLMTTGIYMSLLLVVTAVAMLETTTWVFWTFFFLVGSWILWFSWILGYTATMLTPDMFGIGVESLRQGPVWLLGPLVLMSCLWIELSLRHLHNEYRPTPLRLAQEIERMPQEPGDNLTFDRVHSVSVVVKQPEESVNLSRKRSSYLGFTPFQENEQGDDFVMGQADFVLQSLDCKDKHS